MVYPLRRKDLGERMTEVTTEENGRYTEIYIDSVPNGSIAYDEKNNELVVDCRSFRTRDDTVGIRGVVAELPDEQITFENEQ